jgi:deoxycytidylate deaminase
MHKFVGPAQNTNYLKSAIARLYGDDDDFIIIGLTGRTGSGCSTVAKILQSEKGNIRYSLFSGTNPVYNDQRKERILLCAYQAIWSPFLLIQVRSIITTFLLDQSDDDAVSYFKSILDTEIKVSGFRELLVDLRVDYDRIKDEDVNVDVIKYYTKTLPDKCDRLKDVLGESAFVRLYQIIGKNIRLSGHPYNGNLKDGEFFVIVERINEVIKRIRLKQKSLKQCTYIVVDAIRNPLEAVFFQDRYSSFFLMAVSAPERDRWNRLRKLKYSEEDINSIDKIEYTPKELDDTDYYSVQDIQGCLQRSDLYVSNPDVDNKVTEYQHLSNQLIKFVLLIRRPGIIAPSAVERCMQIAYTAKLNSGCISRQVGAVVADPDYSIRSIGWNDVPSGQVPCSLRNREDLINGSDLKAYSDYERKTNKYIEFFVTQCKRYIDIVSAGRNNSFCFKSEYNAFTNKDNQVHTRSLHAEENAFLQLAKYGSMGIRGGVLFTTASPCELCSKKAYQLGIERIYYIDPYPGIAIDHILCGGVRNPELILFSGAIGRAFHKLYSPIVPYKDELKAITSL